MEPSRLIVIGQTEHASLASYAETLERTLGREPNLAGGFSVVGAAAATPWNMQGARRAEAQPVALWVGLLADYKQLSPRLSTNFRGTPAQLRAVQDDEPQMLWFLQSDDPINEVARSLTPDQVPEYARGHRIYWLPKRPLDLATILARELSGWDGLRPLELSHPKLQVVYDPRQHAAREAANAAHERLISGPRPQDILGAPSAAPAATKPETKTPGPIITEHLVIENGPAGNGQTPVATSVSVPDLESWMPSDEPLSEEALDKLKFVDFANAIAAVIDDKRTATPLTLAISGPWGVGKSSLAQMLEKRLDGRYEGSDSEPHTIIRFDAWLHQASDSLGASLVAEVARKIAASKPRVSRFWQPLPAALLSAGAYASRVFAILLTMALGAGVGAWLAITSGNSEILQLWVPFDITWATMDQGPLFVAVVVSYIVFFAFVRLVTFAPLQRVVDPPNVAALKGDLPEVAVALRRLANTASETTSRFVVVVDNLDRCVPERSVQVMEAIAQYLQLRNFVTIVLADTQTLARHADAHFHELTRAWDTPRSDSPTVLRHFGHDYLQKIFQLEFTVPRQNPRNIGDYLLRLSDDEKEEIAPKPNIRGFRARMRRKWGRFVRATDSWAAAAPAPVEAPADSDEEEQMDEQSMMESLLDWTYAPVRSWSETIEACFRNPGAWRNYRKAAIDMIVVLALAVVPVAIAMLAGMLVFFRANPVTIGLMIAVGAFAFIVMALYFGSLVGLLLRTIFRVVWLTVRFVLTSIAAWRQARRGRRGTPQPGPLSSPPEAFVAAGLDETKEAYSRILLTEEQSIKEALHGLGSYGPSLPRTAKRVLANVRLSALILKLRGQFDGTNVVSIAALAKWVNLADRWPAVGSLVRMDPPLLERIEAEARKQDALMLPDITDLNLSRRELVQLHEYLRAEPSFAGQSWRLVRLEDGGPSPGPMNVVVTPLIQVRP